MRTDKGYQVARVLSPLTWDVSQKETVVPLSGPPKSWIQPHGTTPGCIACKQRESKGTLHGRVHGKNCKQRYKEFLEQELRKRREREREFGEAVASSSKKGWWETASSGPNGLNRAKSSDYLQEFPFHISVFLKHKECIVVANSPYTKQHWSLVSQSIEVPHQTSTWCQCLDELPLWRLCHQIRVRPGFLLLGDLWDCCMLCMCRRPYVPCQSTENRTEDGGISHPPIGVPTRMKEAGPPLAEWAHETILKRRVFGGWQLKRTLISD